MMSEFANIRGSVVASVSAHALLVLFAQFGLPHIFTPPEVAVDVIPVELVTADELNAPTPAVPEPEPEPEAAAPPPPPPPPPEAPPEPVVEPEVVEAPPPPPPEVKPEPPEKKPPEPEKPKPEPPALAKAQPLAKPKPPRPKKDFASVLKDLARTETEAPKVIKKPDEAAPKDDKPTPTQQASVDQPSITEIERLKQMIREQVQPCWSPPVGAAGAEDLAVTIFIRVDQRGFVREARVIDAPGMALNGYVQAAADAARRAVLNPRCQPFNLPQKRYDLWKEIRFNFDPREMLG